MAFLGPSLRRKRVSERPALRVAAAIALSLAANAGLLLVLARIGAFTLAPSPAEPTRIALAPLTAEQWASNRALPAPAHAPLPRSAQLPAPSPLAPPEPEKPTPTPPPAAEPKGQVVDVTPSPDSRPPEKSRFLSERDSRVEKETRSRWAGTQVFERRAPAPVAGGKQAGGTQGDGGKDAQSQEARRQAQPKARPAAPPQSPQTAPQPPQPAPAPAPAKERAPGPSADGDDRLAMLERPTARPQLPTAPPPPAGGPSQAGTEGLESPGDSAAPQAERRKAGDPRLLPSLESMSRIAAGPSNDRIDEDVALGDATALNTRAFKFASFWNRFKQDVSGHWRPAMVYDQRDPDHTMFGSWRERATALHVVLDAGGAVKEVRVIESSGLDFLDREAVRAVRAAAPFYNVPSGLLDERGEVPFSFGMVLVMDRAVPVHPRYGGEGPP
jgi:TonB family protein